MGNFLTLPLHRLLFGGETQDQADGANPEMENNPDFGRFLRQNLRYLSARLAHNAENMLGIASENGLLPVGDLQRIRAKFLFDSEEGNKDKEAFEALVTSICASDNCEVNFLKACSCLSPSETRLLKFLMKPDIPTSRHRHRSGHSPDSMTVVKSRWRWNPFKSQVYKMTSKPRGYFVIINYKRFPDSFDRRFSAQRDNTEKDVAKMVSVARGFEFIPKVKFNLKLNHTVEYLTMISKDSALGQHDALVVMIMSHGMNDHFFTSDGVYCKFHIVRKTFSSDNCPDLVGKPKILIFVCCRGTEHDGPDTDRETSVDTLGINPPAPVFVKQTGRGKSVRTSAMADMITIFSTSPGYVSHRHDNGTFYVETLAKVFATHAHKKSLTEMLAIVCEEFDKLVIDGDQKQTPAYEVLGMSKKLFFNPGLCDKKTYSSAINRVADKCSLFARIARFFNLTRSAY